MIIPLINCPSWHLNYPPYNLALLKAVLAQNGFDSICFDLNLDFYNQISDETEKQSWLPMQQGSCWERKEFVSKIFKKHAEFIQAYLLKIINLNSKVVCFTVNNRNRYFTYLIADRLKEMVPEKKIIFGGPASFRLVDPNISLLSQSCADAVCIGEGEISFINFLKIIESKGTFADCPGFAYRLNKGTIVDCGDGPMLEDLNLLPFADFSDFDVRQYFKKSLSILTSKSCNNTCSFCSERPRMRKYRIRTAENVYSEICFQLSKYPNVERFWFNDSLINGDIALLDTLCNLLIKGKINVKWGGQATIEAGMSLELLNKMKQAGCDGLSYGVESASDKVLGLMHKKYTAALAERVLRNTYEAGIGFNFNIIVGFPGETEKEFQETVDFVRRNMKYAGTITLNTLNFQEGSSLNSNPQKWNISVNKEDSVSGWTASEGANNYQERLRRLRVLREIVGKKSSVSTDKEVDFDLSQGDKLLRSGKKEEALKFYFLAQRKSQDTKMKDVIKDKISAIAGKPIYFTWDIHYRCNFRCPYCWFFTKWVQEGRRNIYLSPEEWMVHWKRVYDRYGSIRVEITGGEPFIYPNFIKLVKLLSSIHRVKVTTNMSGDIAAFVKEINPERVNLDLNFHPLFIDIETLIKKALLLKEAGFKAGVCYLAYPPQMGKIDIFKRRFEEAGINFALAAFWGEYAGRRYPECYTQQEIELIRPFLGDIDRIAYHLKGESPKGKLCNAGYKYAVVQADGKVIRCGQLADKMISNFLNEDFHLLSSPEPCEADSCPCNEYGNIC